MNKAVFDLVGNLDTLLAVTLGAVLATLGALFAELIEDRMDRKRRERDTARFFGEILSTMGRTIDMAAASQKIGDPWGFVTQRMFKMAQREAQVYERNRERLFDISDVALRARIHTHFLTEMFPLEAIIDNSASIDAIRERLAEEEGLAPEKRAQLEARVVTDIAVRQRALDLLIAERAGTGDICADLEKVAKVKFAGVFPGSGPAPDPQWPPVPRGEGAPPN
ncbi:MAG TPA: hypothetical protein DDZ68_01040 [Parvularcula sp.]|nr:hypothetical protein [Parvularcula sp.]HBS32436.1 hypothetical protein [Parvularcula sp.]HBS34149.1 hypothetical protein [Parvularcula sp.]